MALWLSLSDSDSEWGWLWLSRTNTHPALLFICINYHARNLCTGKLHSYVWGKCDCVKHVNDQILGKIVGQRVPLKNWEEAELHVAPALQPCAQRPPSVWDNYMFVSIICSFIFAYYALPLGGGIKQRCATDVCLSVCLSDVCRVDRA